MASLCAPGEALTHLCAPGDAMASLCAPGDAMASLCAPGDAMASLSHVHHMGVSLIRHHADTGGKPISNKSHLQVQIQNTNTKYIF